MPKPPFSSEFGYSPLCESVVVITRGSVIKKPRSLLFASCLTPIGSPCCGHCLSVSWPGTTGTPTGCTLNYYGSDGTGPYTSDYAQDILLTVHPDLLSDETPCEWSTSNLFFPVTFDPVTGTAVMLAVFIVDNGAGGIWYYGYRYTCADFKCKIGGTFSVEDQLFYGDTTGAYDCAGSLKLDVAFPQTLYVTSAACPTRSSSGGSGSSSASSSSSLVFYDCTGDCHYLVEVASPGETITGYRWYLADADCSEDCNCPPASYVTREAGEPSRPNLERYIACGTPDIGNDCNTGFCIYVAVAGSPNPVWSKTLDCDNPPCRCSTPGFLPQSVGETTEIACF